jgi:hypothetical protein
MTRLFKPELLLAANATIKKFVAGRAENPDHVGLSIFGHAPCAVSFKFRAVRNFENSGLSAGFARIGHIRISAFQPIQSNIFKLTLGFISWPANFVLSSRPNFSQISRGLDGALIRAISLIGIGRLYQKMLPAVSAVASMFCRSFMFLPPNPSSSAGAIITAPFLVRANGLERFRTLSAKQIMHVSAVTL